MTRKVDMLVSALTSHNVSGQQAALMTIINEYVGIETAAGTGDDQLCEDLFTTFGDAIASWMYIDALSLTLEKLDAVKKRLPRQNTRVL